MYRNQVQQFDLAVSFGMDIINVHASIRDTATHFNIPKSTVHFYITNRIDKNSKFYKLIQEVLQENYQKRGQISNAKSKGEKYWK